MVFMSISSFITDTYSAWCQKLSIELLSSSLLEKGLSPQSIKDRLEGVYGDNSPPYSVVEETIFNGTGILRKWLKNRKDSGGDSNCSGSTKKKMMATIFWGCYDILLIDFKERYITVNSTYYTALLHELQQNIRERCVENWGYTSTHCRNYASCNSWLRFRTNWSLSV